MKKNKFFAGVLVLLFVFSFSVSQLLLAEQPASDSIGEGPGIAIPCCVRSGEECRILATGPDGVTVSIIIEGMVRCH